MTNVGDLGFVEVKSKFDAEFRRFSLDRSKGRYTYDVCTSFGILTPPPAAIAECNIKVSLSLFGRVWLGPRQSKGIM